MNDKPISPLRQRMIEDMTVRNFGEKTRHDYIRHVKSFAAFLGRSPDTASADDLRRFQLHQTQNGVQPSSINSAVSALRFFFTVTLDRPEMGRHLTFVREPRKIPVILSPEEIARLLEAAPGPKYKAALSAAYGAGLRVSEVVALKVSDVDSKRMLLRIEQGKGRKDRVAISNRRLISADASGVSFKYKDYRVEGPDRYKVMTLATEEFIRRFLMHVLPKGFHRIRHYGLFAKSSRLDNIARARVLLNAACQNQASDTPADITDEQATRAHACPHCGGRMVIIETFERGETPRHRPTGPMVTIRIDTS